MILSTRLRSLVEPTRLSDPDPVLIAREPAPVPGTLAPAVADSITAVEADTIVRREVPVDGDAPELAEPAATASCTTCGGSATRTAVPTTTGGSAVLVAEEAPASDRRGLLIGAAVLAVLLVLLLLTLDR